MEVVFPKVVVIVLITKGKIVAVFAIIGNPEVVPSIFSTTIPVLFVTVVVTYNPRWAGTV